MPAAAGQHGGVTISGTPIPDAPAPDRSKPPALPPTPEGYVVCEALRDFTGSRSFGYAGHNMVFKGWRVLLGETLAAELSERGLVRIVAETTAAVGPTETKG